jgi:predicted nucleotidyltransferase component of viral defense system
MTEHDDLAYHDDVDLFRDALFFTESETGLSARLIEKDYYCSVLLQDLLSARVPDLAFKGGTSLSKVHGDFYRLSEDLDFGISTPLDAPRRERSKRVAVVKDHLGKLPQRVPCFQITDPLRGYNNFTQYNGRISYRSLVTGQEEFVKVEISVREPIIEPVARLPAKTLLTDPFRRVSALDSIPIAVLSCREAYAEKLRAALTRRDPAVRDFYDVDHAFRTRRIKLTDRKLIGLVRRKLAAATNEPIDVSQQKLTDLRKQVNIRLKPVLRERDFAEFDLDHAFEIVRRFAEPWRPKHRRP